MVQKSFYSFFFLLLVSACASAVNYSVKLNDQVLPPGGVTVLRLDGGPKGQALFTSFAAGEVFSFESETGTLGLVAVDLETEPGSYELVMVKGDQELRETIEVVSEDYGTENINLPSGMVTLDEPTLKRVEAESVILAKLWHESSATPLWSGPFIMPVEGRVSGPFGKRRVMNGKPRSPHSGMDIAASMGTPIMAANSGRVALTGEFYFIGKFVVIDHGLGVFSIYAHMSKNFVEVGQELVSGEVIGKVGSTGRSTGPHLHFAVKVGKVRVSPEQLFETINRFIEIEEKETTTDARSTFKSAG